MTKQLSISVGEFSDKGVKERNQDCCGYFQPEDNLIETKGVAVAIADGISTSDHSKVASHACINGFLADYFSTPETWSVKKSSQQVLTALNNWLYNQGKVERQKHRGLVTTFSSLVLKSTTCHVIHIGDSRIYRLRQGYLTLLTTDHKTWVANDRSYLSRAMGADTHLQIDYSKESIEQNDIYLLTTDGVHEYLSEDEIVKIIQDSRTNLPKAAEVMVYQAKENGSIDNLTCLILEVTQIPNQNPDDIYQQITELPFPPELSEGVNLDGYKIIRELHTSNRSQLYLAIDTETGLKVAIKTPSVNYEDDPAYIDRFIREEWIGRRIVNPHVVKVYEPTRRRRFLYHISEYLEGNTIKQWMNDHPKPSIEEIRLLVEQIAKGLQAFHRLEMLHQDLKPENIMLDGKGTVKLVDFGSAKVAGISEITTPITQQNLLGTKNYTAPEYVNDQPGTNRSDIYSLGVIIYEMLSGELPYGEMPDNWKTDSFVKKLQYRSVKDHRPDIPHWIDMTIKKAIDPDPKKRYGELSEFLYDFRQPNPEFSVKDNRPLMQRNPVRFWQGLSFLLFVIILILLSNK